jgi:hypothetical protein
MTNLTFFAVYRISAFVVSFWARKQKGKKALRISAPHHHCCHCHTPNESCIAYISASRALLPIFSKVSCTLISVNRLNLAVIVVKVYHF